MNSVAILYSDDITGQWWRYNPKSQDHEELIIDENLGFILKAAILGRHESYEGQIHVIGGKRYYAQIDYNGTIKNGYLDTNSSIAELYFRLYHGETEIYSGNFQRTKVFPEDPKPKKEKTFVFWPTFGTVGGDINILNTHQNEYLFTIEIYSLNLIYLPAGLGLEIIPVKYFYNSLTQSHIMSFINIGLSWNILDFPLKIENPSYRYFFFGPAFSVNWLNLYDFNYLNINDVIFNSGLKFSMGANSFRSLTLETGYRNTQGSHGYYFSICVDNIIPLTLALPVLWPVLFN